MTRKRGFSLVELLVVVAIIALLISLLLPSLARAREKVKTVKCGASMRQMGLGALAFAAQHQNRAPGGGHVSNNSSYAWQNVLTNEVLPEGTSIVRIVGATTKIPSNNRVLFCPSWQFGGGNRMFAMNNHLASDRLVVPPPSPKGFWWSTTVSPNYWLGTNLNRFADHGNKVMFFETERSHDYNAGDQATGALVLGLTPPWAGPNDTSGGPCSFRHPTTSGTNYYQNQGNFIFIDGHLETMKPRDNVWAASRYTY